MLHQLAQDQDCRDALLEEELLEEDNEQVVEERQQKPPQSEVAPQFRNEFVRRDYVLQGDLRAPQSSAPLSDQPLVYPPPPFLGVF